MNGRIYDPLLGRFLSADVLVDGVTSLQGYNRYSYVKNNPLTLTDPSGFNAAEDDLARDMLGTRESLAKTLNTSKGAEAAAELGADVVGALEPTPATDLTHAGYQFSQGRYVDGTLTGIGAIPYAGDLVGKGLKWVVVKPVRFAFNQIFKHGDEAGKAAANLAEAAAKQSDTVPTPSVKAEAPKPEPVEVSSTPPGKDGGGPGGGGGDGGSGNGGSPNMGDGPSSWGNPDTLQTHFDNHGADFGSANPQKYAQQAADFRAGAQTQGLPTKIDDKGVIRIYDPKTNTFGSYNPDGTTKTFYKPAPRSQTNPRGYNPNTYSSPLDYWNKQPGTPQ